MSATGLTSMMDVHGDVYAHSFHHYRFPDPATLPPSCLLPDSDDDDSCSTSSASSSASDPASDAREGRHSATDTDTDMDSDDDDDGQSAASTTSHPSSVSSSTLRQAFIRCRVSRQTANHPYHPAHPSSVIVSHLFQPSSSSPSSRRSSVASTGSATSTDEPSFLATTPTSSHPVFAPSRLRASTTPRTPAHSPTHTHTHPPAFTFPARSHRRARTRRRTAKSLNARRSASPTPVTQSATRKRSVPGPFWESGHGDDRMREEDGTDTEIEDGFRR
ncbi:hypothetical protein HDU96_007923 [Phlyctochytrium bullatum]|nr:hypothetical protein HDU96_007923 [Phlyctochytrium bullatum]